MKINTRLFTLTAFVCIVFYHINLQPVHGSAVGLDIDRLHARIAEVEGQVQERIPEEVGDIPRVLVVGGTGSGKTTLVHALVGKPLEVLRTLSKRELVVAAGAGIPGAIIGHGVDSETSIPNIWYDHEKRLIFCDCPGSDDTRGPEQEIVNAFAIHQLFKKSSELKVLLTLENSGFDGGRAQDAIKSLNRLISLVPDRAKLKHGLMLVITKGSAEFTATDTIAGFLAELEKSHRAKLDLEGPIDVLKHLLNISHQIFAFPAPTVDGVYTSFTENPNVIHNLRSGFIENAQSNISFQFDSNTRLSINEMVNKFGVVERKIPDLMTTIQGNYRGKDLAILRVWAAFNQQLSGEVRHIDTIDKFIDVVQKYLPAPAKNSVQIKELVEKIQSCQRYVDFGNKVNAVGAREDVQSLIKPYLRDMWAELCVLIDNKEALERQVAETDKKLKAIEEKARIQQAEHEASHRQQQQMVVTVAPVIVPAASAPVVVAPPAPAPPPQPTVLHNVTESSPEGKWARGGRDFTVIRYTFVWRRNVTHWSNGRVDKGAWVEHITKEDIPVRHPSNTTGYLARIRKEFGGVQMRPPA